MIKLLILTSLIIFCFEANARPQSRRAICERLERQANENCIEAMCEQQAEDTAGTSAETEECAMDGDFYEGLQICVSESELPDLIRAYNLKNPKKNLNCDDL